jgi:membrane associated rhomboid family serine protease
MPDPRTFVAVFVLLAIPFGILFVINALLGLPRLTQTPDGIRLITAFGSKWANWNSLEPFVIKSVEPRRGKPIRTASAKVIGQSVISKGLTPAKSFPLVDHFQTDIETVVAELNAARARALGVSAFSHDPTTAPMEEPVGLAEFKVPWLTLVLLGVLVAVFMLEGAFAVAPGSGLNPGIGTLTAMGALNRTAVLSNGEWYRLFTAPLLHANLVHVVCNGLALLLGGTLLERLVGRLWFFAYFAVGALGGSLMSFAIAPANQVSVGASGALM